MNNVNESETGLASRINVNGAEFAVTYRREGEKVRANYRAWEQLATAIADMPLGLIGDSGPLRSGYRAFNDLPCGVVAELEVI